MLTSPAPYPYVGSYCLLEHEGRTQLARIVFRRSARTVGEDGRANEVGEAVVSLPLRDYERRSGGMGEPASGASGNLTIDPGQLIDGTPLTIEEEREFHDLDRYLAGRSLRTPRQKAMKARRDALHRRAIWAPFMQRLMRQLPDRLRRAA